MPPTCPYRNISKRASEPSLTHVPMMVALSTEPGGMLRPVSGTETLTFWDRCGEKAPQHLSSWRPFCPRSGQRPLLVHPSAPQRLQLLLQTLVEGKVLSGAQEMAPVCLLCSGWACRPLQLCLIVVKARGVLYQRHVLPTNGCVSLLVQLPPSLPSKTTFTYTLKISVWFLNIVLIWRNTMIGFKVHVLIGFAR